jgi:hypothetical protein
VADITDHGDQLSFFPHSRGSNSFSKEAHSDSEETSFLSQSMYSLCGGFGFARVLWN